MNRNNNINIHTNLQPIPSVFNEGFSQYETICKLIQITNDLINDIKNNRKLDENGNFTGTWYGYLPVETELGIQNVVNEHTSQIADLNSNLNETNNSLVNLITIHPTGTNDTLNWNNSINSLIDGGRLELEQGDYFIDGGILKDNISIIGRGKVKILSDTIIFLTNSGSSSVLLNLHEIVFENIIFEHITKTFSEFVHLISLSGVSDIEFNRCKFIGFKGDGVYLGSGDVGEERHNENIIFKKCLFDGVNHENRNCITVIDGKGIYIDKCRFIHCTKSNMPGAIDLEPNGNIFAIIKDIYITNNYFNDVLGTAGCVTIVLPFAQEEFTLPSKNIQITNNVMDTCNKFVYFRQTPSVKDLTNDILIAFNRIYAGDGFMILGCCGLTILNNNFEYGNSCYLGDVLKVEQLSKKILIKDNMFNKVGVSSGSGVLVTSTKQCRIVNNTFKDCGVQTTSIGRGIYLRDLSEHTEGDIMNNVFYNDIVVSMNKSVTADSSVVLTRMIIHKDILGYGITDGVLCDYVERV